MNFKYICLSAIRSIKAHKMRSFLTILGVLIGVASIIAMVSIGEGATDLVVAEIDQMGANTIMVLPSAGGIFEMADIFYAELFSARDLEALRRPGNAPYIEEIMPGVIVPGDVRNRDRIYRRAMTIGAKAEFFGQTFNIYPEEGVNFYDSDIRSRARVAVVGHRVKEELFQGSEAVGEGVTIGGHRFRVSGVYPPVGQRGPFNIDDLVIIPYTTASSYILGSEEYDRFMVKVESSDKIDRTVYDISALLRETRNIEPGQEDDFSVITQKGLQDQIGNVLMIMTYFLVFVVSIALLVGGIGIMNIMLVSVTERTREIGLRKALGATRRDILKQFLTEAVILTLAGGVLGIVSGVLVSFSVSYGLSLVFGLDWSFGFPFEATVVAVGVSVLVGLIFGLYPAKKAADLSPLEALQYE